MPYLTCSNAATLREMLGKNWPLAEESDDGALRTKLRECAGAVAATGR